MQVYINGAGVISSQSTFDKKVLQDGFVAHQGNRWPCMEPDYSAFIDGKQIRRMSRVIRMGIVSSLLAMREAGLESPDAIIVGTAFGCLEDTNSFLSKLVQYKEDMLSPTAFIHSTHNTIASQIALMFKTHGYNSTYVHKALSFESTLTDALLLMEEGTVSNVLAGGIDEITDSSFTIMGRLGFYKNNDTADSDTLFDNPAKGSVAGEGSAFFSLGVEKTKNAYAKLTAVETLSFFDKHEAADKAKSLLAEHKISKPALLLSGHNGELLNDGLNDFLINELDCADRVLKYKKFCGEFATSSAFATWLAAEILKNPGFIKLINKNYTAENHPENILIYNQQEGKHHSFILLEVC